MSISFPYQQYTHGVDENGDNNQHLKALGTGDDSDNNCLQSRRQECLPTEASEAVVQFRFNLLMSTMERAKVRISLIKSEYIHNHQRRVVQHLKEEGKRTAVWLTSSALQSDLPVTNILKTSVSTIQSRRDNLPHKDEVDQIKKEDNHQYLGLHLHETSHSYSATTMKQNTQVQPLLSELHPVYTALRAQAIAHCERLTLTKAIRPLGTRVSVDAGTVQSSLVCGVYVPFIEQENEGNHDNVKKSLNSSNTVVIACGYENGNTYLFDVHGGTLLSGDPVSGSDGHPSFQGQEQLHTVGNGGRVQAIAAHPILPYLFISRRGAGGSSSCMEDNAVVDRARATGGIEVWHLKYVSCTSSHVDTPLIPVTTPLTSINDSSSNNGINRDANSNSNIPRFGPIRIVSHKVTTLLKHEGLVHRLAVDPTGSLLVSTSADMTIGLWDVTPKEGNSHEFKEHSEEIHATWSPKFLYLQDGHKRAYRNTIWAVAFHPDGSCFITTDFAGTVNVWDSRSGKRIFSSSPSVSVGVGGDRPPDLVTHTGRCTAATWAPSGLHFCTGGDDGLIHMYCVKELLAAQDMCSSFTSTHGVNESGKAVRKGKHGKGDGATNNTKRTALYGRPCLTIGAHNDTITALHFHETLVPKPQYGNKKGSNSNENIRHQESMYLRPLSHWLASTCVDGSVKLWSTLDGILLRTLVEEYAAQPAARFLFSVPGTTEYCSSDVHMDSMDRMKIVLGQRKADWCLWEEISMDDDNIDNNNWREMIHTTSDSSSFCIPPFHLSALQTKTKTVKPVTRRSKSVDSQLSNADAVKHITSHRTPQKHNVEKMGCSNSISPHKHTTAESPTSNARSVKKGNEKLIQEESEDSDEDEMERLKKKKRGEGK